MMSTDRVITLVAALSLRWQESCGDPGIFCYRLLCGLVEPRRVNRLDPILSNHPEPCSIPSGTSYRPSTTSKA
jgi:hypothetical protein